MGLRADLDTLKKYILPLPGKEPRFLDHVARDVVTLPTATPLFFLKGLFEPLGTMHPIYRTDIPLFPRVHFLFI